MIKDMLLYKRHFYKDIGIRFGLLLCGVYLIVFNPFNEVVNVFGLRVWIVGISFSIIALLVVFCNQSRSSSKEIVNDYKNSFYELLLKNEILDEVIFLYKWNVNIALFTILILVTYNIIIFLRMFSNVTLGCIAIAPIFFVVWTISEFRYSNQLANKLNEYVLEYRKIHSKW